MRDRAISLRLDAETERALTVLTASGRTRSDAIRLALLEAARTRGSESLAAEAAALAANEEDRREMADAASLMESLRAEG